MSETLFFLLGFKDLQLASEDRTVLDLNGDNCQ
jgi:hypothetical protein